MSYRILDIMQEYTDRTTGYRSIAAEIVADSASDLPANSADLTFILGTYATVVDTGDKYKIDSSGVWQLQPGSAWTNVYSKTEIDAIIQSVIDGELKRSDIYRGYQITANTDMNDDTLYGNYGTYYCSDGTTAATLQNSPITSSGFVMLNFSTGNRVRLFIAVSANTPRMFIQARTGGTWRTIRQFAMTDEIQYDENMLGYNWGRYNVAESTGDVNPSTTRIGTPDYFEIPAGTQTITYSPFSAACAVTCFISFMMQTRFTIMCISAGCLPGFLLRFQVVRASTDCASGVLIMILFMYQI